MKIKQVLKIILFVFIVTVFTVSPFLIGTVEAQAGGQGFAEALENIMGEQGGVADTVAGFFGEIPAGLVSLTLWILKGFAAFFLGLSGYLLDTAIKFSVDTSHFTSTSGSLGPAINAGWVVVRDLLNMTFIFIVLYIAISTILGLKSSANSRVLSRLVIAALLINFSKFIAGIIIDVGNIVALGFYKAVDGVGLSQALATNMDVLSVYEFQHFSLSGQAIYLLQELIIFVVLFVAALAFFFASLLFIGRIIMFTFLLMGSPIGFAGMILPKFEQYSKKWWEAIINQSMVAPVFLFFMFILIKITNEYAFIMQNPDTQNDIMGVFFNFAIVIGFLIFAVKTTKNLSGQVGSIATTVAGLAGGAALGATALLGRATAGRGAGMLARGSMGQKMQSWSTSEDSNWIKRQVGRGSMATLKAGQTSTFDARQTRVGKAIVEGVTKQTGIKLTGNQAEDGFLGAAKRKDTEHKERAKTYNKAGFKHESKRIEKDPGTIASFVKKKAPDLYEEPSFRSAFKRQIVLDDPDAFPDKKKKGGDDKSDS